MPPEKRKIVFAIDDDLIERQLYDRILGEDYDLLCFDSAEAMLKRAHTVRPDLTILDVGLNGLDGIVLCEAFKKIEGLEDIPVIFVTGNDFSQDRNRAINSGAVNYITKPIDRDAFKLLIKDLI